MFLLILDFKLTFYVNESLKTGLNLFLIETSAPSSSQYMVKSTLRNHIRVRK